MTTEETNLRLALLQEVLIFSPLDHSTLQLLSEALEVQNLSDGERLFDKGAIGDAMYIIRSGSVEIHDEAYIFATLSHPQIVGEYALLDEKERSASVTAKGETSLYRLSKQSFEEIVRGKPNIKDQLLKMLLLQLRQRNDWEEELAAKNDEIRRQRDEIEKQRDLKDRFFSIISHDLRGPVSSFQGIASILKMYIKKERYDELNEMMDEVDHAANQLSSLLDNLLTWATQQQDQIPCNPERIDLRQMVDDLFGNFRSTALAKQVELRHAIKAPVYVWADKNTMSTVFRNLIHNALKFTPEKGHIEVSVSESKELVSARVTDTGVGMKAEKAQKLFTDERDVTFGTKGEKGVGLGLQLVREFVQMNQGQVAVESKEGEGTTFIVTLPASDLST